MGDRNEVNTHPHVFLPTRPTGCQAYAKTTGEQCGIHSIGSLFCNAKGHKQQRGKCCAITRENGKRCLGSISPAGRGYFCQRHQDWATPHETVCDGYKVSDGLRCYRRAPDPGYPFCMTKHDGRSNYLNPANFREDGLRGRVMNRLRERDGDRDRYNPGWTTSGEAEDIQVDHIGEIQICALICQFVTFQDAEEENDVVAFFRELVNELRNLCVTWTFTNQGKGRATTHLLEDTMKFSLSRYGRPDVRALDDIRIASFDVPIVRTFDDRLREERLGRDSTRAIRRKSGRALRYWQNKCLDHGESPVYDVLGGLVGNIFAVFDLHVGTDLENDLEYDLE